MNQQFYLKDGTAMSVDNAAQYITDLYEKTRGDFLKEKALSLGMNLTQLSTGKGNTVNFTLPNCALMAEAASKRLLSKQYGNANGVHLLQTTGAVTIQDVAISPFNAVVQNIGSNMDTTFELSEYFPETMQTNTQQIATTLVNAISGKVPQQSPNSPFPTRPKRGYERLVFQGWGYAEKVDFNEWDLTSLNAFDNWSDLGVVQRFSFEHITSTVRMYTAIKLLVEEVMRTGQYTYWDQLVNYGVPSENRLLPASGVGGYWSLDGGKTTNPNANPPQDFAYWFSDNTQLGLRAEYVRSVSMTRTTFNMYLNNANTRAVDTLAYNNPELFGKPADYNNRVRTYSPAFGRALFGYDVEIKVSDQRWLPETVEADGTITVENPEYILKDGYIYFGVDTQRFGDTLGHVVFTPNIAKGGVFTPQPGIALGVNDSTVPLAGAVFDPTASAYVKANLGIRIANPQNVFSARVF